MIKKLTCCMCVIISTLLLSGCWNYREIDDMANVAGIAIDHGENGFKYHISAEIINISSEKGEAETAVVIEADGNTILETFRKCIAISSKKLYMGHCKMIIISQAIAREGIEPVLDVIVRDHEIRLSTLILIAQTDTAKEILFQKGVSSPIVSYEIEELLNNDLNYLNLSGKLQVHQLINLLNTPGLSAVIPTLKASKLGHEDMTFEIAGLSVFKEDKLLGFLKQEEANLFLLATNQLKGGILTIPLEQNAYLTAEIFKSQSTMKPVLKDGTVSIAIDIAMTISIDELQSVLPDETALQRQIDQTVAQEVSDLLYKVQKEFQSDIPGFGRAIYMYHPELWKTFQDDWETKFPTLPFTVYADVTIRGSGISPPSFKM